MKLGCVEVTVIDATDSVCIGIMSIRPELYGRRSMFPGLRFNCITSNIVESDNKFIWRNVASPPLRLSAQSGTYMHRQFLHLQNAQAIHPTQRFTPWATALLQISERHLHTFEVACVARTRGQYSRTAAGGLLTYVLTVSLGPCTAISSMRSDSPTE